MKFGTGSNTELTQKYARVKVQMTYVRRHIYINKYPRFSIELPLRVFRSLANYLNITNKSIMVYVLQCTYFFLKQSTTNPEMFSSDFIQTKILL